MKTHQTAANGALQNGNNKAVEEVRRPGRWLLVEADGKTPRSVAGRHVLIESGMPALARLTAARYLLSKGFSLDDADAAQVLEWKPNGWHPTRATIVSGVTAPVEKIVDVEGG
jgi:hypothetical protein